MKDLPFCPYKSCLHNERCLKPGERYTMSYAAARKLRPACKINIGYQPGTECRFYKPAPWIGSRPFWHRRYRTESRRRQRIFCRLRSCCHNTANRGGKAACGIGLRSRESGVPCPGYEPLPGIGRYPRWFKFKRKGGETRGNNRH